MKRYLVSKTFMDNRTIRPGTFSSNEESFITVDFVNNCHHTIKLCKL